MIDLNGIKAKNRIWLAAGAAGYGEGWPHEKPFIKLGLIDFSAFGVVITKTLTPELRQGNYAVDPLVFWQKPLSWHYAHYFSKERKKVLRKVPGGWINSFSWWNVGIDHWVEKIYPQLGGVNVIPNIGGFAKEHFVRSIKKLNPLGISAIEIDVSCPNVELPLVKNPPELIKLFNFCRMSSEHPLILKLGIDSDYLRIARSAEYCGINAFSAINSVPALGGGYSGPAIKPIALKVVQDLKKATKLPVIGGGGISSWKDCQEFFEAGADAVALGSGFLDPIRFWRSFEPTRIAKKENPK